jgi:hypothetical protein
MKINTRNKDGSVSPYGFACGYEELKSVDDFGFKASVSLYKEHNMFHIKAINWFLREEGKTNWNESNGFRVWKSSESLTEARKIFKQECKRVGL